MTPLNTETVAAPAGAAGTALPRPGTLADVKGWFFDQDQVLFDWLLTHQARSGVRGNLLEMGAYLGKSAAFLGRYRHSGEEFTVCDLFDSPAGDAANDEEMQRSYATLSRRAFEANYLSFHDELPTIIQGPTSLVPEKVAPGSCRFVHVDASHLYEHVRGDIAAARRVLSPEGVVVLDDYRSEHTPGVSAAVWEALFTEGLRPICLSRCKFYGTWGDPAPWQEALILEIVGRADCHADLQTIAGHRVLRLVGDRGPALPEPPRSRHYEVLRAEERAAEEIRQRREESDARAAAAAGEAEAAQRRAAARRPKARARRAALLLVPPAVTKVLRRLRRR
ncbi:class I SAM-dependent methyltransferase [Streptomyces ochraceiscleroticus]|uniref:Class I SAM-dependent methyltransferase n=1 Tax=Streptomyces ochraceiscleroticus TaxID=47761 RepID=A0ABW1MD03_9ACTN|nr:class I SAM-dependent methyltransferase [Streptomyces ochraceiscleroticus]